jgi:hypothetical protein
MPIITPERASQIRGELTEKYPGTWLHHYHEAIEEAVLRGLGDYKNVVALAEQIKEKAEQIAILEKHRNDWIKPKGTTFWLGHHRHVTAENGTTPAALQGIKREAIKAFDDLILSKKSEIEGLRFKLVNLAKQGGDQ